MTLIGRLAAGLISLVLVGSALASDAVDVAVDAALDQGRDLAFAESDSLGKTVIAIGIAENSSPAKSIESARQAASVTLAGFLTGKNITATDASVMSSVGGETLLAITSESEVSVDAMLRGAQIYKTGSLNDGRWFVALALAEKAEAFTDALAKRRFETTIQSKGFSPLEDDLARSRRLALTDALRSAVEAFSGVAVATKAYIRDAEDLQSTVATVSQGRVTRYEIVEENQSTGSYYVLVIAEIEERPPGATDNIDAILESMGRPGIFVSSEHAGVVTLLQNFLDDLNFEIATTNPSATYIIDAAVQVEEVPVRFGNGSHYSTKTQIDITLSHRLSSDILLSISNDPDESVDISRYEDIGRRNSLNFAFDEISEPLAQKLKSLMVSEFNNGTKITVALVDWFGLRQVDAFESCLRSLPDVKSVSPLPIDKGSSASFEIIYMGEAGGLQVDFKKHSLSCDGLARLKVRKGSEGRLTFAM